MSAVRHAARRFRREANRTAPDPINTIGRNGTRSSSHLPNSESESSSKTGGPHEFPNVARYRPTKINAVATNIRASSSAGLLSDWFAIVIELLPAVWPTTIFVCLLPRHLTVYVRSAVDSSSSNSSRHWLTFTSMATKPAIHTSSSQKYNQCDRVAQ